MADVQLYSYFRSSASFRVRIALHLKKIAFDYIPVHLLKNGGEQLKPEYRALNPSGHVPCLVHNDFALGESMAILNYLDHHWPQPVLFPQDPQDRARVIQLCEMINSGIQPLQNLKVLNELEKRFGLDQSQRNEWVVHWIQKGFEGFEQLLQKTAGQFCFGDNVTAADLYLVPQMVAAQRFKVDLNPFPNIRRIDAECNRLEAFKKAAPSAQPDFEA